MGTREYRVSQGGLFHSHKVQYSKDTQDLLHRLIEESKLSILQRQALKESVKKGEPLPGPERNVSARSRSETGLRRGEVLVPPALPRRRSYQAIIKSGAYQREAFDPPYNSTMKDREVEKQKLQSLMTYGKDVPPDPLEFKPNCRFRHKVKEEEADAELLFDHLVEEVQDRLDFLRDMEGLGQAKAYQTVIEQEIAAKMRQMAKLDQTRFLQLGFSLDKIDSSSLKNSKPPRNSVSFPNNIFPQE